MTTYTLAGSFGWAGGGKSGAIVDIWATTRFSGVPAQDQAPPSGNPDAGPVTTGSAYGSPGAYEITNIAVLQDYYVRIQYGGQTYWGTRTAASLGGFGGGGGGGGVNTVFGRAGNVTAQVGDYTPTQVGADPVGSAATAQSNAETFATNAASTAQANAEAASLGKTNNLSDLTSTSTARTNLGLGTAATQASSAFDTAGAAAAAQAAAEAASLPLAGGTMSGNLIMGSHAISGVSDLATSGLTGATAAARFVGGTVSGAPVSGGFLAGDFVIDQSGAVWVCTFAGTPGTWVNVSGSAPLNQTVEYNPNTQAGYTLGGSFVALDATNLSITFAAPASGDVKVTFEALAAVNAGGVYQIGIFESGAQVGPAAIVCNNAGTATITQRFKTTTRITGIAAGSHTYDIAGGSFNGFASNVYAGGNGTGGNISNNAGPAFITVEAA